MALARQKLLILTMSKAIIPTVLGPFRANYQSVLKLMAIVIYLKYESQMTNGYKDMARQTKI